MAEWTAREPCPNCSTLAALMGKALGFHGQKLRCDACGTLGCRKCLGDSGQGTCKKCKKSARKEPA